MYNFLSNSNIVIGNGCFSNLCDILIDDNFHKPLLIIDSGFANTQYCKSHLKKFNSKYGEKINIVLIKNDNEPNYEDLSFYLKQSKQYNCNVVVGIGGGSSMDISKAIGALLNNNKSPIFYKGFNKLIKPGVPVILVPTVAGTGSEASYNASFVDEKTKIKMGINGRFMFPYKAVLDAETNISCPRKPSIGAAMDSLVHAIEAYICNNSNSFSDMLAEKAFELIIPSILDLNSAVPNMEKRLNLLKGAYLAGLAQMNAGGGLSSSTSYPLSVYYKIPHGIAGAIFLLDYCKFNVANGVDKYQYLLKGLHYTPKKTSKDFLDILENIVNELEVPKNLSSFGLYKKDKKSIEEIMQTQQLGFDQNPVNFSAKDEFPDFIDKFLDN